MNPTSVIHPHATETVTGVTSPAPEMRATRAVVTLTSTVIAACAFAFSFGNIWHLALAWGVPSPIAPLVAPMLDVSVVGLLIAIRQLSLHGVPGRALAGARGLMLVCAVTTWGLNIAQAILDRRWGGVVIDSVAPALLLGWAEVGPTLLRLTTIPAAAPTPARSQSVAVAETPAPGMAAGWATPSAMASGGHTPAPGWAATPTTPPALDDVDMMAPPRRWRREDADSDFSGTAWEARDGKGDLPHVA
jgi:hypothetical protein